MRDSLLFSMAAAAAAAAAAATADPMEQSRRRWWPPPPPPLEFENSRIWTNRAAARRKFLGCPHAVSARMQSSCTRRVAREGVGARGGKGPAGRRAATAALVSWRMRAPMASLRGIPGEDAGGGVGGNSPPCRHLSFLLLDA